MDHRKDRSLDALAGIGNVAQFVSYMPIGDTVEQTYSRVAGYPPNHRFESLIAAVNALLETSLDGTVNVRSYTPDNPRSREFVYGIPDTATAVETVTRLSADGLFVIVNETIDIEDGGVSGVFQSGILEFAPDDTPRCVEKPGVASLPVEMGIALLKTVYGFEPELGLSGRSEFSIHPRPRGWRQTHTLLWEHEDIEDAPAQPKLGWPNRFSRHIGDKAYGLIMAQLGGLLVPRTLVISRRVAPFEFGRPTGSPECWIRTCPREQEPGLFTTHKGWLDPFALLAAEDPEGDRIASVLRQDAVPATWSGAAIKDANGDLIIEGIAGEGDEFMLGRRTAEPLPADVARAVEGAYETAEAIFGPVRLEWVFDGERAWTVQCHRGSTESTAQVLVPGDRSHWIDFEVSQGLEALRSLVLTLDRTSGLNLRGDVGMTSHIADLVRKSGLPTRVNALAGD